MAPPRVVEFKEAVPEEVGHAVAHASMVLLDAQVLLWVGEARQPMLGNLHYAIGGAPQGGGAKVNATTLTGNRFEGPGRSVAERLCAKLGIAVVCSWNVSCTPEEQDCLQTRVVIRASKEYLEITDGAG